MSPTWQEVKEITHTFREIEMAYWLNDSLLSIGWWVLVITTITLVIVWIIIVDKERILEIMTYGLMVLAIGTLGDALGLSLMLWEYPISILHTPQLLEVHNVQMPIFYMIIYQYFRTWKSFLLAALINALVFGLIFEPILEWLRIYELYSWKHVYSIVPYFVIAVGLKWLMNKLKQLDQHYQ